MQETGRERGSVLVALPLSRRSPAARLSIGALGLTLVLMVSAAWATGVVYLQARLGLGWPLRPALVDGAHAYVGVVGGVFVAAKVARVGLRHRVRGVPSVVPWQRWVSWSLLVLYGAVFVSGVLLFLPIRGVAYNNLVNVHLLASIWAVLPTSWHVWHYRRRALPYLTRWRRRGHAWRYWIAIGVAVTPAIVLLTQPRAASQLPLVMAGPGWSRADLAARSVGTVTTTADGRSLLAAGDALYLSHDGMAWSRIEAPVTQRAAPQTVSEADNHPLGHEAAVAAPLIQAVASGGDTLYVGTSDGLFRMAGRQGTLERLAFPGNEVGSIAVSPADPRSIWAASASGPMFTGDGGQTWTRLGAGLRHPTEVPVLACWGDRVFASDLSAVYEWSRQTTSWVRVSGQEFVVAMTPSSDGRRLYAFSPSDGLLSLTGDRWQRMTVPGPFRQVHAHGGAHARSDLGGITAAGGRLYVAGTSDGVTASADGGRTWTQLDGGIAGAAPTRLTVFDGQLWAATPAGLYRLPLAHDPSPSPAWWLALLAAALGIGAAAAAVAGLDALSALAMRRRPAARRARSPREVIGRPRT